MAACCWELARTRRVPERPGSLEQQDLEGLGVEGQPEPLAGGLAEGRPGHHRLVLAVGVLLSSRSKSR